MAAPTKADNVSLKWCNPREDAALYQAERELRAAVLAAPVGLTEAEFFPFELDSLHLVAVLPIREGESAPTAVGCVLFNPDQNGSGRLFQMAVAPSMEGCGLGARLVRELEAELPRRGVRKVTLHSRLPAAGFYAKLGYSREGEEYEEVGIPHINMVRSLGDDTA